MENENKKMIVPDENFRLAFEKVITEKSVVKNRKRFKLILDFLIQEKGLVSLEGLIKAIYHQMYGDDFDLNSIGKDSRALFVKKIIRQMDKYLRNLKCRIQFVRGKKNVSAMVYIERLSGYLSLYDSYISKEIEMARYIVVYRYTKIAGGNHGVITWSSYESREDFEKIYDDKMKSFQEVVDAGVTEERAIALFNETALPFRLAACVESAMSEVGDKLNEAAFLSNLGTLYRRHPEEFIKMLRKAGIIED